MPPHAHLWSGTWIVLLYGENAVHAQDAASVVQCGRSRSMCRQHHLPTTSLQLQVQACGVLMAMCGACVEKGKGCSSGVLDDTVPRHVYCQREGLNEGNPVFWDDIAVVVTTILRRGGHVWGCWRTGGVASMGVACVGMLLGIDGVVLRMVFRMVVPVVCTN